MNKQLVIICGLMLLGSFLTAASHYGFTANGFEASATNLGMGGSPIAAVSYWHHNPQNAYGNPAFPSLHEGFSYSGAKMQYKKLPGMFVTNDFTHRTKLSGFGYRGIGLLTSLLPVDGGFNAMKTAYGEIIVTDESGHEVGTFHPQDKSIINGVSLNLQEFTRNYLQDKKLLPQRMDLALGINYKYNDSEINPDGSSLTAGSFDTGLLSKVTVVDNSVWKMDTAVGASLYNTFNQSKECTETGRERIYKRLNMAGSISGMIKYPGYDAGGSSGIIENYGSLRIVAGACEEFASDPMILAAGTELGIADMLFLRIGYHDDKAGKIKGVTWGIGVYPHYGKLFGIHYAYAEFPSVKGWPEKFMHEVMVNMDFLSIWEMMGDK